MKKQFNIKGSFLLICIFLSYSFGALAQTDSYTYNKLKSQYNKVYWSSISDDASRPGYYKVEKDGKYGLCSHKGDVIVKPEYSDIEYMDNKTQTFIVKKNNFAGVVDVNGHILIPANKYSKIGYDIDTKSHFETRRSNYFKVYLGNKVGMTDSLGNLIVPATTFTDINYWESDSLFHTYIGYKTGLLDKNGKEVLKPVEEFDYLDPVRSFKNGTLVRYLNYFIVRKDSDKEFKYGVVDGNGNQVVPRNNEIPDYYPEYDLFVCTDYQGIHKAFNGKGKKLFEGNYILVSQGVIIFQSGELWGMMNATDGTILVEPKYTSTSESFDKEGNIKVSIGGQSFIMKNPLQGGGVVSSIEVTSGRRSDVDLNIPNRNSQDENTFAIVIANENYREKNWLFAINDGQVFRDYCLQALGIPQSNILYQEDATLNNINKMLDQIKNIAEVYDGEAKLVFYFSGMGMSDEQKNAYLLPSDAEPSILSSTAYPLARLCSFMASLNVQYAVVILDASFSNQNRDSETTGIKAKACPVEGNCAVLLAEDYGENNQSYKSQGHGLFTYYILKKIQESKGDKLPLYDLAEYVRQQVGIQTKKGTNKQTPQIFNAGNINTKRIFL